MILGHPKLVCAVGGLALIAVVPMTDSASAISVDVAKKCDALTAKAFPPRQIGNPAAGSASGTGADRQAYFNECVARESKAPETAK
jgi:hypothetical protein